jgi:hypothetical protein
MPFKRFGDAVRIAIALPIYQIMNLAAYAKTREGWSAKIATVVLFLPIIAFTTTRWVAAWAIFLVGTPASQLATRAAGS